MNAKPFFDTNILLYTLAEADPRADVARFLLSAGGSISVQILNEFVATARRRLKMSWPEIRQALSQFRVLCQEPLPVDVALQETALRIAERYQYQIYDSLVIAAALKARSTTLYSEDLRDGQRIEGLTIRNPFLRRVKRD